MSRRAPLRERTATPAAGRAPDFTRAFLVCAGVLVFMGLVTVWAVWGWPAVVLSGWLADRAIARLGRPA